MCGFQSCCSYHICAIYKNDMDKGHPIYSQLLVFEMLRVVNLQKYKKIRFIVKLNVVI